MCHDIRKERPRYIFSGGVEIVILTPHWRIDFGKRQEKQTWELYIFIYFIIYFVYVTCIYIYVCVYIDIFTKYVSKTNEDNTNFSTKKHQQWLYRDTECDIRVLKLSDSVHLANLGP